MTDEAETIFDEIVAMSREERRIDPDHPHRTPADYREADLALDALRVNLRGYRDAARRAQYTEEAASLRAQAARIASQARQNWIARLDAAKAKRARFDGEEPARQWQRRQAIVAGGCISRPPRDAALLDAIFVAKRRLDDAWPRLGNGLEYDFQAVLDDIENAMRALGATVGMARRASRAREKASVAAEAVAAVKAALSAPESEQGAA